MYIESKLEEVNETLFSLDLLNLKEGNLNKNEILIQHKSWLEVSSRYQYARGLFMVETFIKNEKVLTDNFKVCGEYIQISYLGKGESHLLTSSEKTSLGMGRINCCYNQDTLNKIEMPSHKPTRYQALFLSREYYLQLLKHESWVQVNRFYQNILNRKFQSWGACYFPINYNLFHLLNTITQNDWDDASRDYLLEHKLKELFLSLHYCQNEMQQNSELIINEEDLEKLRSAHAYLVENFKTPPSIKELSKIVLLNELKLKTDFKKVYKKTIRSFIIELRMENAKTLLGKLTVSEMAGELGYRSVPHFINTFKKYYGYTPKQSLNQ